MVETAVMLVARVVVALKLECTSSTARGILDEQDETVRALPLLEYRVRHESAGGCLQPGRGRVLRATQRRVGGGGCGRGGVYIQQRAVVNFIRSSRAVLRTGTKKRVRKENGKQGGSPSRTRFLCTRRNKLGVGFGAFAEWVLRVN
jgi:hypothetical protein